MKHSITITACIVLAAIGLSQVTKEELSKEEIAAAVEFVDKPIWEDMGKIEVPVVSGIREISFSWRSGAQTLDECTVTVVTSTVTGGADVIQRKAYAWQEWAIQMRGAFVAATGLKPEDADVWWRDVAIDFEAVAKMVRVDVPASPNDE